MTPIQREDVALGAVQRAMDDLAKRLDMSGRRDVSYYPNRPASERGLFNTYRVGRAQPYSDLIIYVFPYLDPVWTSHIRKVVDLETYLWERWWQSHYDTAEVRANSILSVFSLPPLGVEWGQVNAANFQLQVEHDTGQAGVKLLAYLRPLLPWPNLQRHPLDISRLLSQFGKLFEFARDNWPARGFASPTKPPVLSPQPGEFGMGIEPAIVHERNLLGDGRQLVCTHWRVFHPHFAHLNVGNKYLVYGDEIRLAPEGREG